MSKVRKSVLILASLVMTAGLSFGAPVHWPKLHHKTKQDQSADTQKSPKQKKAHRWLHHEKKSKKAAASDSQ